MSTTTIPKFRSTKRLIQWMERHWHEFVQDGQVPRLPPDRERIFLKTKKEQPQEVAACLARYAGWAGRLDAEYESVMRPFKDSLFNYLRILRNKEIEVPQDLLDELAGDSRNLYRWSKVIEGRLPTHLEDTISEPKYAYLYAKEILLGRLPRHLEDVFFKDVYYAAKYAFEVIRGFASVRLPDKLHTFMIMKSFEDPSNENIRTYVKAAESDPNRVGNSEDKPS